jgi:hypothetical protein
MGLTNGHAAFASINESGFNKFIRNIALARPHYLNFATAGLGGGSPGVWLLPPLTIPGAGLGLDYEIKVEQPVVDFFPQNQPLPGGLTLKKGQFSITTGARVCVVCAEQIKNRDQRRGPLICADVHVWAVGHPTSTPVNATDKLIGLVVDDIVVKNVGDLEKIAECLSKDVLNALLAKTQYLVAKHVFGAFGFFLGAGPVIEDDQIKVWGDIT